jgi:epoxyqueuosine reductase
MSRRASPSREEAARLLKGLAREEGFELAGIAAPNRSAHGPFLRRWVAAGRHGVMGYLARPKHLDRREDPKKSLEQARSILVVGHQYFQDDPSGVPGDPSRGVIARYARGRDYHRVVKKGLGRVHRRLEGEMGRSIGARSYVDTGPVLERELGERAGLGWFGRNTMLIHPRKGSYFFLGVLLLELEAEPDPSFDRDHCGGCRACLDACPTSALLGRNAEGAPVMDATRCISYLTIENPGPIPREFRPLMGNRIYGCDICQEVCPFNVRFAEPGAEAGYAARGPGERPVGVEASGSAGAREGGSAEPDSESAAPLHPGTDAPSLVELLRVALSEEGWEAFSRGSAIRRAGRAGFARNVCVALGNWLVGEADRPPEAAGVLAEALSDPEPLVRGHAAWALGEVGSPAAVELLSRRVGAEPNSWVASEIIAAREPSRPAGK